MSDENRELVRYELDISQFKAKAEELIQTEQKIRDKRNAGGDTGVLKDQYDKQAEELTKLVTTQDRASNSTDELLKNKEKLGQAVQLLGGKFGGLVGQIGGVVDMMLKAGPATAGVAASLAAVAIGQQLWKMMTESIREYVAELDRASELHQKLAGERLGARERAAQVLEKAGMTGAAGGVAERASKLSRDQGIDEDVALFGATAAQLGGLDDEGMQRVMRGFLITGRSAQFTGDREKNAKLISELASSGATSEAASFFAGRISDTGEIVKSRNAAPDESSYSRSVTDRYKMLTDKATREMGLNEKDVQLLWRLRNENLDPSTMRDPSRMRRLFNENWDDWAGPDWISWAYGPAMGNAFAAISDERLEGGTQTLGSLRSMAQRFQESSKGVTPSQPTIVNINNIGTMIAKPDTRARPSQWLGNHVQNLNKEPLAGG